MEESKQILANIAARLEIELKEVTEYIEEGGDEDDDDWENTIEGGDEDDDDWENTIEVCEMAKCDLEHRIEVLTELINNFPSSYIGDGRSLTLEYLMADLKSERVTAEEEEKITLSKEIETLQTILDIR